LSRIRLAHLAVLAVGLAAGAVPARSETAEPTPPGSSDRPTPSWQREVVWGDVYLRTALTSRHLDEIAKAVATLERIDFAKEPAFEGADRAAFLLAQSYVVLGDLEALSALAEDVSSWSRRSDFTRWVTQLGSLASLDHGAATTFLEGLGDVDTTTVLGRELVALTTIRRASAALERGEDPAPLLEGVPRGSALRLDAEHMLGVAELERGEARGADRLARLLAEHPEYPRSREVLLALAGRAMENERWADAVEAYRSADAGWDSERDAVAAVLASSDFDRLWARWDASGLTEGWIPLETNRVQRAAALMAERSLDLHVVPSIPCPLPELRASDAPFFPPVEGPTLSERQAVDSLVARERSLKVDLDRTRAEIAAERAALARWRRYLAKGIDHAEDTRSVVARRAAELDSLRAAAETLSLELAELRDTSIARFLARADHLRSLSAAVRTATAGMTLVHVDGPNRERPERLPEGVPAPSSLLAKEDSLAVAIDAFAEAFAREVPDLVRRSHDLAWRPIIIDRIGALAALAGDQLATADRLLAGLQATLDGATTSRALVAFQAREQALVDEIGTVAFRRAELRAAIARAACERRLAAMANEREGIDYGLATSLYAWSTAGGTSRQEATAELSRFLETYPASFARADVRFHLADLLLANARAVFQASMASFVAEQAEGREATPPASLFVETSPAIALYRAILTEDPDYVHRDAVLFNAGMLLADEGDPDARSLLDELVARHPSSSFCQEAHLRLGDLDFEAKNYLVAAPAFEKAAAGEDAGLSAIALYKLGWSHFAEDHFAEAADAFRRLMDVYETETVDIKTDLRGEAEDYFVHALARAGGASTFASYFAEIGPRPYEERVLDSLARLHRKFSLYEQALEDDRLYVERYGLRPDALVAARRAIETCRDWNKPDLAREAQLAYARRFAPGGEWATKNATDSLRAEGASFARNAWKSVALYHHDRARGKDGTSDDYRKARELYRTVLGYWPEDEDASKLHLYAGEASAKLAEYPAALEHYAEAAKGDSLALVADASWQRVAVTDAWYASTRPSKDPGALGADTLATRLLEAANHFVNRFPADPRAADIHWRHANLAFAHGRYPLAASSFEAFVRDEPTDARRAQAAALRADAIFRTNDFARASDAYAAAVVTAREAKNDSLAARLEPSVAACFYKHAETVAAQPKEAAAGGRLFAEFARRWPAHEAADAALYKGALLLGGAGRAEESAVLLDELIRTFPQSSFVQDAHLALASLWEREGDKARCAEALVRFADRYPSDESGSTALLKAADLLQEQGKSSEAEALQLRYIERYPNDFETAMEVLAPLARRDLDSLPADGSISTLLPAPVVEPKSAKKGKAKSGAGTKNAKGGKTETSAAQPPPSAQRAPSHLAAYLALAEKHPELASKPLLAETRFLHAEEVYARYSGAALVQPIAKSIEKRKVLLEEVIQAYKQCAEIGSATWAHASAYRIGQALVDFGTALKASEPPADLSVDDREAYDAVLDEQAWGFYDRGEDVWSDLLTQKGLEAKDDDAGWLRRTKDALWARLALRFAGRPELEYPLVEAVAPVAAAEAQSKEMVQ